MKSKKIVAFVLSLAMITGSLPVMVSADETDVPELSVPEIIEDEGSAEQEEEQEEVQSDDPEGSEDEEADVFEDGEADVSWADFRSGVLAKAGTGEPYVLQGNVTKGYWDTYLSLKQDVVIDLNGYTIDSSNSYYAAIYVDDCSVTIKNGTILGRKKDSSGYIIAGVIVPEGGTAVLEGLTIQGFGYAVQNNGPVALNDCTITGNDTAFECDGSYYYDEDYIDLSGKMIIKDNGKDVCLDTDKVIDISNIGEGSKVAIDMSSPGAFTDTLSETQLAKRSYFISSKSDYYVTVADSKLALADTNFSVDSWSGLQDAVNTIPSKGYIRLKGDCVAASGDNTISIPSGKEISIELYGYKIDKDHNKSGSVIKNAGTLNISDSSPDKTGMITGGHAQQGAGIYNSGTLFLNGGSITDNYSTGSSYTGAGIYNTGELTINGGNVTDNNTSDKVKIDGNFYGGGIYNYRGTVNFRSGSVSGNRAHSGAGIYNNMGTVKISGGSVTGNVYAAYSGTTFGGGLYNNDGTVTITGGTFSQNVANGGGAIYNLGTLTVTGGTFTGNNANSGSGGAIYNGSYPQVGNVSLKNARFTSNHTSSSGGAIYNSYTSTSNPTYGVIDIEDVIFDSNSADGNGGAIDNCGIMTITSSTQLSTNVATNGCALNSAAKGGAVYNRHELTVTNWVAAHNTADKGGAVYNTGTLKLTGATISVNTATANGGGIYLEEDVTIDGKISVTDNKVGEADNNVCIDSDEKIVIEQGFDAESMLGITYGSDTGSEPYEFTSGYYKKDVSDVLFFTSDSDDAVIRFRPSTSSYNPDCELTIYQYQPNIIEGADMTMAEALCFRFTLRLGDKIDRDSAYVMMQGPNDPELRRVDLEPDSAGICVVPCSLYARQLDSDIKYALFDKDGLQSMVFNGTAVDAYKINATQYLTALKNGDYREEAKKLADAMLVYGGFSKAYLENKTENDRVSAMSAFAHRDDVRYYDDNRPLNDYNSITVDSFENYKPSVFQLVGGSDYVGIRGQKAGLGYNIGYNSLSLVAKDKIALRLYFTNDITNADFEIFRTKNTSVSLYDGERGDITNYTVGKEHGMYYIEIPDIAAYDLGTKIYVEFLTHLSGWDGSGYTYNYQYRRLAYGIEISPLSYAYTVMDYFRDSMFKTHADVYLSKALLRYSEDAAAYKNATNQ